MSILEYLEDALDKVSSPFPNLRLKGICQLRDMITLIGLGYHYKTNVDNLINQFGDIQSVPPRRKNRTSELDQAYQDCYTIEEMINKIKTLIIEDKV